MKKTMTRKYSPERQLGIPSEENRGKQVHFLKPGNIGGTPKEKPPGNLTKKKDKGRKTT
jgi:hypothetical protein